jgi:hypothetical protein
MAQDYSASYEGTLEDDTDLDWLGQVANDHSLLQLHVFEAGPRHVFVGLVVVTPYGLVGRFQHTVHPHSSPQDDDDATLITINIITAVRTSNPVCQYR